MLLPGVCVVDLFLYVHGACISCKLRYFNTNCKFNLVLAMDVAMYVCVYRHTLLDACNAYVQSLIDLCTGKHCVMIVVQIRHAEIKV